MYQLTEEQEMIRQMVRQLVQDKVGPIAARIDETEDFPEECFEAFVENGLFKLSRALAAEDALAAGAQAKGGVFR